MKTMPFDAVLLDTGLPDGDGLSVLKHFKNPIASLPVIMLTASTTGDLCAESLAQGAFSFLVKPYNHNELRLLVRQATDVTVKPLLRGKNKTY